MSFQSLIAEQDQEFTYYIKSIYSLFEPEVMDQVRLALLSYDIRDIKKDAYKTMGAGEKDFPHIPGAPSYALKIIIGNEPDPENIKDKVALFTRINTDHLCVHKQGEDPNKPADETESENVEYKPLATTAADFSSHLDDEYKKAQDEVGGKRIENLMIELEKEQKEREKSRRVIKPKLKESFVVSQIALREAFADTFWKKGFYTVDRTMEGELLLKGPWPKPPSNLAYIPTLLTDGSGIIKKKDDNTLVMEDTVENFKFTTEQSVSLRKRVRNLREDRYSVNVIEQDTGKDYNVIVDAFDDNTARDRAISLVGKQHKIDGHRLIAQDPIPPMR